MKSIKEFSKEWCAEHSNKGCKENCEGCWQIKQAWGCEQHNMELAYEEGARQVLEEIENCFPHYPIYDWTDTIDAIQEKIKQLKGV